MPTAFSLVQVVYYVAMGGAIAVAIADIRRGRRTR